MRFSIDNWARVLVRVTTLAIPLLLNMKLDRADIGIGLVVIGVRLIVASDALTRVRIGNINIIARRRRTRGTFNLF